MNITILFTIVDHVMTFVHVFVVADDKSFVGLLPYVLLNQQRYVDQAEEMREFDNLRMWRSRYVHKRETILTCSKNKYQQG
jgi:hypothetical protein